MGAHDRRHPRRVRVGLDLPRRPESAYRRLILNVCVAGSGSGMPSTDARTVNVWGPGVRCVYFLPDVHASASCPSMRHSNVASLTLPTKKKVADRLSLLILLFVMVVSGLSMPLPDSEACGSGPSDVTSSVAVLVPMV